MRLRCPFARRTICVRLGNRVVCWGEPFSRRSGNALAHRSSSPGFPDRRLKGFCTSIKVMNAVVTDHQTKGGERLLLLCLARYAADDGSRVFPSVATLCDDTQQARRAVQYQLRSLEAKGFLRRVGISQYGTANYVIAVGKLKTGAHDVRPVPAHLDSQRGANEAQTSAPRSHESLSNSSKNHQEHLEAISKFLPHFKSAYREKP
jgi:hypothetical protein